MISKVSIGTTLITMSTMKNLRRLSIKCLKLRKKLSLSTSQRSKCTKAMPYTPIFNNKQALKSPTH